jgi:hypothetical protein
MSCCCVAALLSALDDRDRIGVEAGDGRRHQVPHALQLLLRHRAAGL